MCEVSDKKKFSKNPENFRKFRIFSNFLKKSQMFQNSVNLFVLKFKCAKFQEKKILEKNDLWSSRNLKKKNILIFELEIGFFSDFAKKVANVPKLTKFIYSDLHLSQFSAKLKNLLRALSRSLK